MRFQSVIIVMLSGALAACYGTKVPPPIHSLTPPPGLGAPAMPKVVAIPPTLPELLATYRQSLIEQSHHLPHAVAQQYADTEIQILTRRYGARENELQAEVVKRLQATVQRPTPTPASGQAGSKRYPTDTAAQ